MDSYDHRHIMTICICKHECCHRFDDPSGNKLRGKFLYSKLLTNVILVIARFVVLLVELLNDLKMAKHEYQMGLLTQIIDYGMTYLTDYV